MKKFIEEFVIVSDDCTIPTFICATIMIIGYFIDNYALFYLGSVTTFCMFGLMVKFTYDHLKWQSEAEEYMKTHIIPKEHDIDPFD